MTDLSFMAFVINIKDHSQNKSGIKISEFVDLYIIFTR